MRILITGGTGLVGRFIVRDLMSAGHEVVLLGRHPPAAGAFAATPGFVGWQLGAPIELPPAAAMVHAAFDHVPGAYRAGEGADPAGFWRRNYDGTLRLFEESLAQGVRKIVFLSSRAAYGENRAGAVLRETDPVVPQTLYGQLKHATEQALAGLAAQGLAAVSLRATGVYGHCPGWSDHKWQGLFASYLAGTPVAARVATEVHGDDLATAVRLALERGEAEGIYNVSDLVLDRHDLLSRVRALTGCAHPPPPRAAVSELAVMATDRLRSLGWEPGGWQRLETDLPAMIGRGEAGVLEQG